MLAPRSGIAASEEVTVDDKTLFTNFWSNETKTTRNVLARIPKGSSYRPDPKSRTEPM